MRQITLFLMAGLALALSSSGAVAQESPHPDWENVALEKDVKFITSPNEPAVTDSDDARQLVDGLFSRAQPTMWHGKDAVGWVQVPQLEFIVDLGRKEAVRGVALRIGAGSAGVALPNSIEVLVSDDGKSYSWVKDIMDPAPEPLEEGVYKEMWLATDDLKTHGRFIKFRISPKDNGDGFYFFLDEIEVYKGENAWLSLPLPSPEVAAKAEVVTIASRSRGKNVAAGSHVELQTPPNEPTVTDVDDEIQLVDGSVSSADPLWTDRKVVGWLGAKPVEFTIDLKEVRPINALAMHLAAGISGVVWPEQVDVEVSDDGSQFTRIGNLMELSKTHPPSAGYAAIWLIAEQLQARGRYVKLTITPVEKGGGSYLFIDEVEVYSESQGGSTH